MSVTSPHVSKLAPVAVEISPLAVVPGALDVVSPLAVVLDELFVMTSPLTAVSLALSSGGLGPHPAAHASVKTAPQIRLISSIPSWYQTASPSAPLVRQRFARRIGSFPHHDRDATKRVFFAHASRDRDQNVACQELRELGRGSLAGNARPVPML